MASNCVDPFANRSRPKIVRPLSGGATGVPSGVVHLIVLGPARPTRTSSDSESPTGAGVTSVSHLIVVRDAAPSHGRAGCARGPTVSPESGCTFSTRSAAATAAGEAAECISCVRRPEVGVEQVLRVTLGPKSSANLVRRHAAVLDAVANLRREFGIRFEQRFGFLRARPLLRRHRRRDKTESDCNCCPSNQEWTHCQTQQGYGC